MSELDVSAKQRAEYIRKSLDGLAGDFEAMSKSITRAYSLRDWEALGYPSWEAYCSAEYGTHMLKLSASVRRAWMPELRSAGMSTAEVAAACGVNRKTVQRDSKQPESKTATATNVAAQYAVDIKRLAMQAIGHLTPEECGKLIGYIEPELRKLMEYAAGTK